MKLVKSSNLLVRKSKFFGYLFEIKEENDLEKTLKYVHSSHKKFTHLCYAFSFNSKKIFRNDREVGQPGKILLSLLESKKLKNHCLVVLRIFGGIKMGPASVGKSFKKVGKSCLD